MTAVGPRVSVPWLGEMPSAIGRAGISAADRAAAEARVVVLDHFLLVFAQDARGQQIHLVVVVAKLRRTQQSPAHELAAGIGEVGRQRRHHLCRCKLALVPITRTRVHQSLQRQQRVRGVGDARLQAADDVVTGAPFLDRQAARQAIADQRRGKGVGRHLFQADVGHRVEMERGARVVHVLLEKGRVKIFEGAQGRQLASTGQQPQP